MKQDKREITLNEKDSLQDVCLAEKGLALAYIERFARATRTEERNTVKELLIQTLDDWSRVQKLIDGKEESKK